MRKLKVNYPKNRKSKTMEERFWEKVNKKSDEECWEWEGSCRSDGYGQINRGKRCLGMESAHRASWMIHFGEIPDKLHILHKCDNKLCVNPKHLFLGTNEDNMKDKVKKNLQMKGENVHSSKLTVEDVIEIRKTYRPWKRGYTAPELAKKFGVSDGAIRCVISRRNWSWLEN